MSIFNTKKFFLLSGTVIVFAGLLGFFLMRTESSQTVTADIVQESDDRPLNAVVYRSRSCGCCGQYVDYLKKQGLEVKSEFVPVTEDRGKRFGVPAALGSCHTTVIDNYVVEGHVPVEAIKKLLDEQTSLRGISLPQMPVGSPGMPGVKTGIFEISGFTENTVSEFMRL